MGALVTWFEVNTKGAEDVARFYAEVFNWTLEPIEGGGYTVAHTGSEHGIEGGIGEAQGPNQVTFYVEVDDPQAYLDRIEAAGGKTLVPVTETPMITFAQFADPQGNVIGLVKSSQ